MEMFTKNITIKTQITPFLRKLILTLHQGLYSKGRKVVTVSAYTTKIVCSKVAFYTSFKKFTRTALGTLMTCSMFEMCVGPPN
jgi:hypothetical protein